MARHNPYAPRTSGTARRSPGKETATETAEIASLIEDARGVDFYKERPPLDTALAGSTGEASLDSPGETPLAEVRDYWRTLATD